MLLVAVYLWTLLAKLLANLGYGLLEFLTINYYTGLAIICFTETSKLTCVEYFVFDISSLCIDYLIFGLFKHKGNSYHGIFVTIVACVDQDLLLRFSEAIIV